jgi:hypothetical protein
MSSKETQQHMIQKIQIPILATLFLVSFFFGAPAAFAALSCTVSTSCSGSDVVVFKMKTTTNSHAELPSQNNYPYSVCCGGVEGLANTCANTWGIVLRLSGDTNAHVEESNQSTTAYNGHNACLSVPVGSVTIEYKDNNCNGFDTTVVSMSKTTTNSHIGDANAYPRKVCASASLTSCNNTNVSCSGGVLIANFPTTAAHQQVLKTADFNGDGRVDVLDLSILLYYTDRGDYAYSIYDLSQDGVLDFQDVSILFYYWDVF